VISFDIKFKNTALLHKLRFILRNDKETALDFIYNSKHGLLINDAFNNFDLKNVTRLYLIVDQGKILYLSNETPLFADIFHS
jgi:hypothetical protein